MRGILFASVVLSLASPGYAETYKCQVNGHAVYQQEPCTGGAALGTIAPPDVVTDQAARENRSRFESEQAVRATAARRKNIDERIEFHQNSILSYEAMMDSELAALRARKSQARNNLAGATWEQSISTEMEAVAARYATKIRIARDEIDALQRQRSALTRQ